MSDKRVGGNGGKFVLPGDKLGVIEEYLPGRGTYVDEGTIYSSLPGFSMLDRVHKDAEVQSQTRRRIVPEDGDVVLGRVSRIHDKTLTAKIFQIGDNPLGYNFTGVMHISDVSTSYIKTMHDAFKLGDIVRFRVISNMNAEFHLSTKGGKQGVLHSVCSRCGSELILSKRRLRCTSCNSRERRKIASDYGQLT